jgi:hypothetical protein
MMPLKLLCQEALGVTLTPLRDSVPDIDCFSTSPFRRHRRPGFDPAGDVGVDGAELHRPGDFGYRDQCG